MICWERLDTRISPPKLSPQIYSSSPLPPTENSTSQRHKSHPREDVPPRDIHSLARPRTLCVPVSNNAGQGKIRCRYLGGGSLAPPAILDFLRRPERVALRRVICAFSSPRWNHRATTRYLPDNLFSPLHAGAAASSGPPHHCAGDF